MSTFLPTSSACHLLQLPHTEKDDRLNLNVRTGSASTLYNSFVFTFGGLTIGLELHDDASIENIYRTFKQQSEHNKYKDLDHYMSGELFCLDLIGKKWTRIKVPSNAARPKPRMFHELARGRGCVYLFGGLAIPDDSAGPEATELEPMNDLWEFNLEERKWILLHDGANDPGAPKSRYCIKMTRIEKLPYSKNKDHPGLIIAGGLDQGSKPLYSNVVFDLVDKKYVNMAEPLMFCTNAQKEKGKKQLENFSAIDERGNVNVNYLNSIMVNFLEDVDTQRQSRQHQHNSPTPGQKDNDQAIPDLSHDKATKEEESIIIYSPAIQPEGSALVNPLLSFKIGPRLGKGKMIDLQKYKSTDESLSYQVQRHTIPLNLRYPTGGLFGHNIVITGFLPDDLDISIFIFNKPTGIWSRLNVFCHHDYGSHRFWGGFVWLSHHKVILLGNHVTSRTTSSVRYFSSLITVSLPVTNILASIELDSDKKHTHGRDIRDGPETIDEVISTSSSFTEDETSSSLLHSSDADHDEQNPTFKGMRKYSSISRKSEGKGPQNAISFSDYTHYAAPKAKFTKVRSVFPASAITLGRNAFDRYGDMISDFELISATGDRIPVCLSILVDRWGKYFVRLLSKAYVKAIDHFESGQYKDNNMNGVRSSKSSDGSSWSTRGGKKGSPTSEDMDGLRIGGFESDDKPGYHSMKFSKNLQKETLQFRLPFQDTESSSSINSRESSVAPGASVDPHNISYDRKNSYTLISSEPSILNSNLQEIPPQLPLPSEPIPAVPATPLSYRSSSRKNSTDAQSPRASLMHTLTALRSIPTNFNRSPKASPFTSPRGSVSHGADSFVSMDSVPRLNNHKIELTKSGDSSPESGLAVGEPVKKPISKLKSYSFSQSMAALGNEDPRDTKKTGTVEKEQEPERTHALLNFQNIDPSSFRMEPSLIPRKLYIPCETESLKAFTEYLYTGQVGNKWPLHPCALDCLLMSRFYEIPHLYDLLCEVLFGVVGRKEAHLVREGRKLKEKYVELLRQRDDTPQPKFYFPLDVYEGLMNTVDDGYLDIALLRKSTRVNKNSVSTISTKTARSSTTSSYNVKRDSVGRRSVDGHPKRRSQSCGEDDDSDDEWLLDESSDGDEPLELLSKLRDFREKKASFGPRSKSVFDRLTYESVTRFMDNQDDDDEKEASVNATIEQLVSTSSPAPSNNVIRLIYETASLCSDVKLMLRSLNVISMTETLRQTEMEYERLERSLQHMDTNSPDSHGSHCGTPGTTPRLSVASTIVMSHPSTPIDPPRSMLQTLAPVLQPTSRSGTPVLPEMGRSASQPDISRSPTAFKLTPYNKKLEPVESNKEVDRRITQMIKLDERMKQKVAKEERAKRHQLEKLTKKKGRDDVLDVALTRGHANDDLELVFSVSTVKLGLLKKIGSRIIHPQVTAEPTRLSRTDLTTSMLSGSSKNSGKKGFFGLRKKR